MGGSGKSPYPYDLIIAARARGIKGNSSGRKEKCDVGCLGLRLCEAPAGFTHREIQAGASADSSPSHPELTHCH